MPKVDKAKHRTNLLSQFEDFEDFGGELRCQFCYVKVRTVVKFDLFICRFFWLAS